MRRALLPLIIVALLAGSFTWWWTRPERVIARRVTGLFQSAVVEAGSGTVSRGLKGAAIEGYLAPDITFSSPQGPTEEIDGLQSRDTVTALYASLAKYCRRVSLETPEIGSIVIDGDKATVQASVDAVIELPDETRPVDGIQELTMDWRKIEGKWRMAAAEWRETGR
ncbi:nuclear transport factor 2 family protein [Luteolibacter marinus]|uniref:nuclear transport factor 2 family protein n=1 Tax=Luteolibacter marinus TaxID=2776705 RepID=UPI001866A19F|nr:nuclear transport factor 2 family protein [Luteolibacter marinus]